MKLRNIAFATVFAVLAALLVPTVSASAVPRGQLGKGDSSVGIETNATNTSSREENSIVGELLTDGGSLVATEHEGKRVTVSALQSGALVRTVLEGDELDALRELVGDDDASGTRVASAKKGADYLIATDRAGFSVLIKVASVDSDSEYAFDIGLPDGATLILTDEGSVDVLGDDRYTIGSFDAPWAVDANGEDVPTHFAVEGNTITQIIETDETTAYPVTADPRFTWGWFSGTAYFDKWETILLCGGSMHTLNAMAISAIWFPILAVALAVMVVMSCTARLLDKCIKVKSYGTVSMYSGGYCTWYH